MRRQNTHSQEPIRVLVFSDDWGRHPSSCQHLVRHMLDDIEVVWVNTIGTRRPSISPYTLQRGLGKLRQWLGSDRQADSADISANPTVVSPLMWPSFNSSWGRSLNKRLLSRQLRQFTEGPQEVVAVTTLPIIADLLGSIDVGRWIYYCVDDLSQWPGLDSKPLQSMELDLVEKVDDIIAASENLANRLEGMGRASKVLTHGIDLDFWASSDSASDFNPSPARPPYIVFWGVIDRRLDSEVLHALSQRLESGSILLIGPQNNPDPELEQLANVHLLRARKYEFLPVVAQSASVMIMPYAQIPVNQVLQPLKFKEYLATGNPTVVTDLPAVRPWSDCCDIARDADHFAALVLERLDQGTPNAQMQSRRRLEQETWEAKAKIFKGILLDS